MSIETTYSDARARFAELSDRAIRDREIVVIHRRGAEDVVLISAAELEGLLETAHLLRSPMNARRLLTALLRAQEGTTPPDSLEALRREVGLGETE